MLSDIFLILLLVALNGAFALSEIAVVSSKRARLAHMAESGSRGARQALALAAEPTRFLSSVQVGITSIGILSGAIGEATISGHIRTGLQQVPALSPYAEPLSLGLMIVSLTYVSLILGELVPKRLALTRPEAIASLISRPMQLVATIARPIVFVLSVSTDTILRLLGVRKTDQVTMTMEEIKLLIEQSTAEGVLEPGEHDMVRNVLNLDDQHVGEVLTPRSEVVFLDLRDPDERSRERLRQRPHSVLPLCDGGLQNVIGFVRATRVLEQVLDGRSLDLPALVEPPLFVPETMTLMTLLEHFKRANLPAALVVDEFGQVDGLVTLTDVISSIVGDLPGENGGEPLVVRREDGGWLLDGTLDLATVVRTLDDAAIVGEHEAQRFHTLGGLAMTSLGRVPRTGDVFERGRHRFEVVDMDGRRVDRVLVNPLDPAAAPASPEE